MKCAIEYRDRKIAVLSEKINAHLSLFASIEKEAFFVKKVVDNAQHVLSEKEEVGMYFGFMLSQVYAQLHMHGSAG